MSLVPHDGGAAVEKLSRYSEGSLDGEVVAFLYNVGEGATHVQMHPFIDYPPAD